MTVKQLKEILENVDPEQEIYMWNEYREHYTEATFASTVKLNKLEDGKCVYDEDDNPVMFNAFVISY